MEILHVIFESPNHFFGSLLLIAMIGAVIALIIREMRG